VTRRAALVAAGAAAGGFGLATLVSPPAALAVNTEYFVNAADSGAVGNGEADDSEALQEAIDESIELGRPLYLPPGTYRTTKGLVANSTDFAMFGAGSRLSVLVPDASSYDCLTIGPGEEGSGVDPSGYARDFGIEGGDADVFAVGVEPDTGKAAFKLSGMRLFSVQDVAILSDSSFDIGFDLVDNCFGSTFHNVRTGYNACRVGLNLRTGPESGSDMSFFNSWLAGEVAAVYIGPDCGGFHFYGGQMSSSNSSASNQDERGTVIAGKEYTTGAEGRSATTTFDGIDFEGAQRCWGIRSFDEISFTIRESAFNSGNNPMIGVFKGTDFKDSRLVLVNNRIIDDYSSNAKDMVTISGSFDGCSLIEQGTGGEADCGDGTVSYDAIPLLVSTDQDNAFAFGPDFYLINGMLIRRNSNEPLEFASSWELKLVEGDFELVGTWRRLTPSSAGIASASEISVPAGLTLAKISGGTTITSIKATFGGHVLTLKFATNCQVTDGSNLKLSGNFSATAEDTLQLVCDGANWLEISRSAN
jgi:hypothetical protein